MVSVSVSLWGGGKRHPGFLLAFPIKLGGSPSFFSENLSLEGTPQPPSLSGGLSRGIGEGAADTTGVAVKTGGPKHSRATSDGSEGPREGQGRPGTGGEGPGRGRKARGKGMHCTPWMHRNERMKKEEGGGPGAAPHLHRPQVPGPAGASGLGPFSGSGLTGGWGASLHTTRRPRTRVWGAWGEGEAVCRLDPETRRRRRLFLRREDGSGGESPREGCREVRGSPGQTCRPLQTPLSTFR